MDQQFRPIGGAGTGNWKHIIYVNYNLYRYTIGHESLQANYSVYIVIFYHRLRAYAGCVGTNIGLRKETKKLYENLKAMFCDGLIFRGLLLYKMLKEHAISLHAKQKAVEVCLSQSLSKIHLVCVGENRERADKSLPKRRLRKNTTFYVPI